MLPGQEVNKDVYAVNTGNIAAFVKEDVSGVLNYTYESKVNNWDKDCVKLTLTQAAAIQGGQDGYKLDEAGGFLAWTDATKTTTGTDKIYVIDGTEVAESAFTTSTATATDSADQNQKNFSFTVTVGANTYYIEDNALADGVKLYKIENGKYTDTNKTLTVNQASTTSPAITPGPLYSGRTQDITTPWTPTETGTYIFRRAIKHDDADNNNHPTDDKFTYAGYYFVKAGDKGVAEDTYYKIVIGNDPFRASEDHNTSPVGYVFDTSASGDPATNLGTGITINADGSFTGTPKISFVKDTKVDDKKVSFKYEDSVKPRLVVEYAADLPTTTEDGVEYDASAYAARREVDYYNKLGESNKATILYNQAKADYDYATALLNARNTLIDAADARANAASNLTTKTEAYKTKWENLIAAAGGNGGTGGVVGTYNTDVKAPFTDYYAVEKLFTPAEIARMKATTGVNPVLPQAKANIEKMESLQGEIVQLDTDLWNLIKTISTANKDADENARLTPTQVNSTIESIKSKLDDLSAKIKEYKEAYSAIKHDDDTATALHLTTDTTTDNALNTLAEITVPGLKDDMDTAASEYKTAYDEYQAALTADTTAASTWTDAITTYNNTVGKSATEGAKADYEKVVTQDISGLVQPTAAASYTNNGDTLVPKYSANTTANQDDPKIANNAAYTSFVSTVMPKTTPTAPTPTDYNLNTLKDAMDTAVAATDAAKNQYDDAVTALQSASTIKIFVNLAPNFADNWQMDNATDKTQDVVFYLKSILDAGETSGKLIDSVELDKDTTSSAYKNLTFDLNVGLDSAQINYANDQRTITTEATAGWALQPTLTDNQSIDTAVTWAAPTP